MKEKIVQEIERVVKENILSHEEGNFVLAHTVTRPVNDTFGDFTSNVALTLARPLQKSPSEIAELIKKNFSLTEVENIEIVAPGYLNFFLTQNVFTSTAEEILRDGKKYGDSSIGAGEKVNNEFISANPTGPLTVGNGRGGFYTDALANVLRKAGYEVTNEYYVNDAGEQVLKLGHSVLKDSEAVYGGEYIEELHKQFASLGDVRITGEKAAQYVLEEMIQKSVKEKMQIHFDVWTSEKALIAEGFVDKALALLQEKGLTFEEDGALWLRTTEFGDDKDRVLMKSDGAKTYFASDAGYIVNKMERGFTFLIETWGADHHGYINRFKAVAQALGFQGNIHFLIVQLVKVVKDGVEVRMSKRAGNVVTIDELIETVGHDVARFFFLMYAPETHMNFDLGLAEERSQKNPVFYVQYAHARLCSILRKAEEEGFVEHETDLTLLTHEKERQLMRELLFFPELVETVATDFSVHKLPQYAMKLADKFHSFYDACRVIESEKEELTEARLRLVRATKVVLGETLALMGISAPEKM